MSKETAKAAEPEVPTQRLHRTIVRSLACQLSDEELLKKGTELAQAVEDIQGEDRRQADIKASMKARMTALEARRDELSVTVRRREEERDVQVEVWHDYSRAIVYDVRTDTGEVLFRRPMTDDERQQALPMETAAV